VERWNDRQRNASYSNLWLVSTGGGEAHRLTDGLWRDTRPRWSPDGARLAWISDLEGRPRIRVWDGSAEVPLSTGELAPLELAWSPDGARLAFTASDGGHIRLFVVPAGAGEPRAVSPGTLDCRGEPAWMPDGRAILTATSAGDIVALGIPDGAVTRLATGGRNEAPRPSPDGSKIAWLATADHGRSHTVRKLWVMAVDGTRARPLSGALDRDAAAPRWSADSRTVYFLADDRGSTHLYAARNDGTLRQATTTPERLRGFSLADNGRAASVRWSAEEAGAVVAFDVYGLAEPRVLARPNQALVAARAGASVEALSYESAGRTLQAWMTRPPDFDPARKYPLLVDLRDDPRRMCGPWLAPRSQILAARGWVVLCANPRGTPGYGEVFGGLLATGGDQDVFDDLMRAVDAALAKGFIAPKRLAVVGGPMAAWTIGHTSRFRAAVARRSGGAGSGTLLDLPPKPLRPGDRIAELEKILDWLER
jgi:dipeptidyl aminopeptidase/acylaminoacyl peptidase